MIGWMPFVFLLIVTLIYFSVISFSGLIHFLIGVVWTFVVTLFLMIRGTFSVQWIPDVVSKCKSWLYRRSVNNNLDGEDF